MSTAMKLVVLNTYGRGLWSYVNRFKQIHWDIRRRVERADADFVSRVHYFSLGLLSHTQHLYGIRVQLQDFQLANGAGLIATALKVDSQSYGALSALQAAASDATSPRHPLRPSVMVSTAFGYYARSVGETAFAT